VNAWRESVPDLRAARAPAPGYAAGCTIAALLFDVMLRDPLTFAGAAAAIMAAGLAASWLPARRAGRVGPVAVLRT
jgi:ABC-type lipoprotein release transport system permease subunit